jgi:N-methylhydantoinase B
VSPEAALADYGVVLTGSFHDDSLSYDADATKAHREEKLSARTDEEAFFDRGPGYATLSGGVDVAAVDWL